METKILSDMLVLSIPILEKILRPIIIYFFLVFGLRLAGKRELAQLNPFDLVVLLTLSNTVQNAIIGNDDSVTGGIIGATTLLVLNYAVVRFLYRHETIDQLVEGRPDVLIDNGRVIMEHLNKETITLPELKTAANRQGFSSLKEVERAEIQPGGTILFTGRQPAPETRRHNELLTRLEHLSAQIAEIQAQLPSPPGEKSA